MSAGEVERVQRCPTSPVVENDMMTVGAFFREQGESKYQSTIHLPYRAHPPSKLTDIRS